MSISHLSSAHPATATHARSNEHRQRNAEQFVPGEFVSLRVSKRLDERHYLVSLANSQHVVESSVRLEVGSRVRAAVVSVGEKLELKYVSSEENVDGDQHIAEEHEGTADEIVVLERKYAIALDRAERETIREEMRVAGNPAAMAASGLYLSKLAVPVQSATLNAIYASQIWSQPNATVAEASEFECTDDLAQALGDALDPTSLVPADEEKQAAETQLFSSGGDANDPGTQRDLARRVLNIQDESSVGYSYGLLPVMIGNELVELDLVYFRDRRELDKGEGVRRLVMSFSTEKLGRVEIMAQALGDRLSVAIKTDSALANEALAARVDEARELAARLGWNVESLRYDIQLDTARAAKHIIDHVLNADTLSRLV